MKKIILTAFVISICLTTFAASKQPCDTIAIDCKQIEKVIAEDGTTAKGKAKTDYYFVMDGKLYKTNKTTAKSYELAQKHGANVDLFVIPQKSKIIVK